ncbi:MAG: hypothetical protein Q9196_005234 [Gyalolechia fulgens]
MAALTRIRNSTLINAAFSTITVRRVPEAPGEEDAPAMHPSIHLLTGLVLLQTAFGAPTNTTSSPLNFLGVHCYHLSPADHVTVHQCQHLFQFLFSSGNVYHKIKLYNGWVFKAPPPSTPQDACIITIASPDRKDRNVMLSMADLVAYSGEVLRECGTGGANTFEGQWSVIVTKDFVTEGWRSGGRVDVS